MRRYTIVRAETAHFVSIIMIHAHVMTHGVPSREVHHEAPKQPTPGNVDEVASFIEHHPGRRLRRKGEKTYKIGNVTIEFVED